jgi:hypothetical protein
VYLPATAETNYIAGAVSAAQDRTVIAPGTVASTTTLASSLPTATFGQSVTLTATVTVAAGAAAPTGGIVEFWDGATYLGKGTLAVVSGAYKATFTTTALSKGDHSITARFVGIGTYKISASDILSQTIG